MKRETGKGRTSIAVFDRSLILSLLPFVMLASSAWAEADDRVPLARMGDETIYVDEVEGALALRIFKHELDIYSLLVSEAERRLESGLLERAAEQRGLSVDALLTEVEGGAAAVSDAEIDRYLAEHPPRQREGAAAGGDGTQRERVRHYLAERGKIARRVAFLEELRAESGARILLDPPVPPRTEIDVSDARARGPENAPVVIVQFTSLASRNAARSAKKIDRLRAKYPGKIRQVHRHFLRDRDEAGLAAARIATVAQSESAFWTFHDEIFAAQSPLSVEKLLEVAKRAGIPESDARAALDETASLTAVKRDIDAGNDAGVPREPSLFINGRFISGLSPYDEISEIVADELQR